MMTGPVLTQLRQATGDIHRRLDEGLRVVERLGSPIERASLVRDYFDFYAAADAAIGPWLFDHPSLDYAARRRTPLMRQAMAALKIPAPAVVAPSPILASRGEALGALYVVEGSSLGGRMILRELAATGADVAALGFLDPYGPQTGERWRSFIAALEIDGMGSEADVVTGALAAFARAQACLGDENVVA